MEPKFTKGPWNIATTHDGETYIKAEYEAVLEARWEGGSQASLGVTVEDLDLIAAEPDMYAALEEIVEPWEGFLDVEVYEKTSHVKAGQIIRARTSLSRARGETK